MKQKDLQDSDHELFRAQKAQWKEKLKKELVQNFCNRNAWVQAISERQSIKAYKVTLSTQNPLKKEWLPKLLHDLDKEDERIFEINDKSRFGKELLGLGVSVERMKSFKRSQIIILEAIILSTLAMLNDLTHQCYQPYFAEPLKLNDYFKDFQEVEQTHRMMVKPYLDFFLALFLLENKAQNRKNNKTLRAESKKLLVHCVHYMKKNKIQDKERALFTQFLEAMAELVDNPTKATWDVHQAKIQAIYHFDTKWANALKATIIGLIALALITITIMSALATFGAGAPITPLFLSLSLTGLGVGPSCFVITIASLVSIDLIATTVFFAQETKGLTARISDSVCAEIDRIPLVVLP